MVSLATLWLPILLAALAVWFASAVIHMVLGYHGGDYGKVPSEDRVRESLRAAGVEPGEYAIPHAGSAKAMQDPAFIEKTTEGPVALLTVLPSGPPAMGKQLAQWFLYCVVVSIFVAYLAGRTLAPDAEYLAVFRVTGTTAFVGYVVAMWQDSIWFGRSWSITMKNTLDGLIYALLTAGFFGWLWP